MRVSATAPVAVHKQGRAAGALLRAHLFIAVVVLNKVLELSPRVAQRGHLRAQRGC